MTDALRIKRGRWMFKVPSFVWKRVVAKEARRTTAELGFMSAEHRRVRNFVVVELARTAQAVAPEEIADRLGLALPRVGTILDELEAAKFFLVRDGQGAVSWAYPVTADTTPHHVDLDTDERLHAA